MKSIGHIIAGVRFLKWLGRRVPPAKADPWDVEVSQMVEEDGQLHRAGGIPETGQLTDFLRELGGEAGGRMETALWLLDLVERAARGVDASPTGLSIWPPLAGAAGWRIALGYGPTVDGDTLDEAVRKALVEMEGSGS